MLGNVKNVITGTYHSIKLRHAPRYLAEFCYRHNRRFQLEDMISRFGYMAVRTPPMPGKHQKLARLMGNQVVFYKSQVQPITHFSC